MLNRLMIIILAIALPAWATDGGSGFTAWYNNIWGNEASRGKLAKCEIEDDANIAGFVGYANNLFCHIEHDLGVKDITPAGGVTGTFLFASTTVHVHIEVAGSAGGATYNGYDYEAKLWGCAEVGNVTCTQLTDFHKFAYVTWSYSADKSISKGVMVHDQYIQNGTTGLYVKTTWDTGTNTATKTLQTLYKSGTYFALADRQTVDKKIAATISTWDGTNGNRIAFAADLEGGVAGSRADFHTGTTTSKNDSPTLNCYTRVASGDDFDMTTASASDCSTLPTVTYPNVSTADLATYNTASVTGSSGGWTAMTTNPSSL